MKTVPMPYEAAKKLVARQIRATTQCTKTLSKSACEREAEATRALLRVLLGRAPSRSEVEDCY